MPVFFDHKLWKEQAKARIPRFGREKYRRDLKGIIALNRLVDWCEKQGLSVEFRGLDGLYDPDEKLITIGRKFHPETQATLLIHEIGHHLIEKNGTTRHKGSRGYKVKSFAEKDKSLLYAIEELDEEYEAWERGRKLALKLHIDFDQKRFDRVKVASLRTYIDHLGLRPKKKH